MEQGARPIRELRISESRFLGSPPKGIPALKTQGPLEPNPLKSMFLVCELRPISLLRLPLLTCGDSNFPGKSLWAWDFHPIRSRFCLSQALRNPDSRYRDWPGLSIRPEQLVSQQTLCQRVPHSYPQLRGVLYRCLRNKHSSRWRWCFRYWAVTARIRSQRGRGLSSGRNSEFESNSVP